MMPEYRKSSYSNGNGGNNCVEVQEVDNGWRHVRNSKMPQYVIAFTPTEWDAFVKGVKAGEFD